MQAEPDWTTFTDWPRYRARIEHEDGLLHDRANLFLVVNGLGAVAVGLDQGTDGKLVIVVVALLANVLWFCSAKQTVAVLRSLTRIYVEHSGDPVDAIVRESTSSWPAWFHNSRILGTLLPVLVILGWLVALLLLFLT